MRNKILRNYINNKSQHLNEGPWSYIASKAAPVTKELSKRWGQIAPNIAKNAKYPPKLTPEQILARNKELWNSGRLIDKGKVIGSKGLGAASFGVYGSRPTQSKILNTGIYGGTMAGVAGMAGLSDDPTKKKSVVGNAISGGLEGMFPWFNVAQAGTDKLVGAAGGGELSKAAVGLPAGMALGGVATGAGLATGPVGWTILASSIAANGLTAAYTAKKKNEVAQIYQNALQNGTMTQEMLDTMAEAEVIANVTQKNDQARKILESIYKSNPELAKQKYEEFKTNGVKFNPNDQPVDFIDDQDQFQMLQQYIALPMQDKIRAKRYEQYQNTEYQNFVNNAQSQGQYATEIEQLKAQNPNFSEDEYYQQKFFENPNMLSQEDYFNQNPEQYFVGRESDKQAWMEKNVYGTQPQQNQTQTQVSDLTGSTWTYNSEYGPINFRLDPNGSLIAFHSMVGTIKGNWSQNGGIITAQASVMGRNINLSGQTDGQNLVINGQPAQRVG